MGGTKDNLDWPSLPIYLIDKSLNNGMVAVVSCNEKELLIFLMFIKQINIYLMEQKCLIKIQDIIQNQCL